MNQRLESVPATENLARRLGRGLLLALATCACLAASRENVQADWPSFRGPWGDGHVSSPADTKPVGLPLRWSETNNVKWKTELPYRGLSTPAVMDEQVWLTAATEDGHDFFVLCVEAESGKIIRNEKLFHCDKPEPLGNNVNTYASPSPALEPGRAYVHFGSYGTACLDARSGKTLWQRSDLPCRHYRGPSSSLVLFENLLLVTMDGADVQYQAALNKVTGETVWKTNRSVKFNDADGVQTFAADGDLRKAHSTPYIAQVVGQPQLLIAGAKAAYAYDPRNGHELWQVRYGSWSAAPMALYRQGLAYFVTGHGKTELWAVKTGGHGDVTDTHVAWKVDSQVAKTASPILVDDLLYMVSDEGRVTCLEAATGQKVWSERLPGKYAASPVYGDGRLYFANQQGVTTVLKPGRAFEPLSTNMLAEGMLASPAVAGKAFYLRTKTQLYRIEDGASR